MLGIGLDIGSPVKRSGVEKRRIQGEKRLEMGLIRGEKGGDWALKRGGLFGDFPDPQIRNSWSILKIRFRG
jgi:hypothetical protein